MHTFAVHFQKHLTKFTESLGFLEKLSHASLSFSKQFIGIEEKYTKIQLSGSCYPAHLFADAFSSYSTLSAGNQSVVQKPTIFFSTQGNLLQFGCV